MIYTFHPHAERELEEVQNYYASIRNELGESFRLDVGTTPRVFFSTPPDGKNCLVSYGAAV